MKGKKRSKKNPEAKMNSLFPGMKPKNFRGERLLKQANGRAFYAERHLSRLAARGMVESAQAEQIRKEIRGVKARFAKGRLTEAEATAFLSRTEFLLDYIQRIRKK